MRGAIPRAAASRSVAETASRRQPHSSAAPSSGRFERSSCGEPASSSSAAGPTACQASGIEKSRRSAEPRRRTQSEQAREDQAERHEQRDGGRRQQHEHRDEHELRRHDVARADGELDPRHERVEGDEREGDADLEAGERAGQQQERARHEQEERAGGQLGGELATVDAARAQLPRLLEEALGGVFAVHVVDGGQLRWVIGR